MSWLKVEPSRINGEVVAQPSKSYTHRFLSIALLADGVSEISNPLSSLDTRSTFDAVERLGGEIEVDEDCWRVSGTGGDIEPRQRKLDVRNSGTTLRFMSAISALSPELIQLTGDKSILKRPMGPLVDSLSDLGADAECRGRNGRPPVIVGGGLEGGETRITGSISSQFISAILIASPYSEVGVDLEVEDELISKPYVRMTMEALEPAGAVVRSHSSLMKYSIPGEQIFKPFEISVPGDFSSASFLLGAAALTDGEVELRNLDPDVVQGDRQILDFLQDFGADVKIRADSVKVSGGGGLSGIDADCSDTPDLVPILAVLGAAAEGQTRLQNIPHLRFKEVDRLSALAAELRKLGVETKELDSGLKIFGTDRLEGGKLESYGDHRMAMALAVAGLASDGGVSIRGAECIDVSYPNFVEDMKELNAEMKVHE